METANTVSFRPVPSPMRTVLALSTIVLSLLLVATISARDSEHSRPRYRQPPTPRFERLSDDDLFPSKEAFFEELLFSEVTPRTRLFDAYTEGCYVLADADLFDRLPRFGADRGVLVDGVLILNSRGPLHPVRVVVFSIESDHVRVNQLVMSHQRITGKWTAAISLSEYTDFCERLGQLLERESACDGRPALRFVHNLVNRRPRPCVSWLEGGGRNPVIDELNRLLERTKVTY